MRIVSLLPSATEIAFALGLGDLVEGVTFECDFPPGARDRRVVSSSGLDDGLSSAEVDAAVRRATADGSPLYHLDAGAIAAIDPDLILTQDLCRVCAVPTGDVDAALDRLGCTAEVLSLDPSTLEEILGDIERVGAAAGVSERAAAVVGRLRDRIAAVAAQPAPDPRPRVLVLEWTDPPFTAGHWIPGLVELAGGEPVLCHPGGHSQTTTWADVADARPDLVLLAPCGLDLTAALGPAAEAAARSELAGSPAGVDGEVWAIDSAGYLVRPGPRVVDGLEVLAWLVRGAAGAPPHEGVVDRVRPSE